MYLYIFVYVSAANGDMDQAAAIIGGQQGDGRG